LKNRNRDDFVRTLNKKGVGASVHFAPPVHRQSYYVANGFGDVDLPVTDQVASSIVSLPIYPGLTEPDLELIISVVKDAIAEQPGSDNA